MSDNKCTIHWNLNIFENLYDKTYSIEFYMQIFIVFHTNYGLSTLLKPKYKRFQYMLWFELSYAQLF